MRVVNRLTRRTWDPWKEIAEFRSDVHKLLGEMGLVAPTVGAQGPSINLYGNDEGLLLTVELPGAKQESLDVTVTGDVLTFRAELRAPTEATGNDGNTTGPEEPGAANNRPERFRRRERVTGLVSRTVQLPYAVDADKTVAKYEHGVLSIKLFRPEQARPRKITVQ